MTAITAVLVKSLRDKTGAGMMDAKKALVENDGNMEAATDWLRAKGLSRAAGKSGRLAAEGLVSGSVSPDGKTGALVELNAETDFVARNHLFQDALRDMSRLALESDGTRETLVAAPAPDGAGCVDDMIKRLVATIGENIMLRRTAKITADFVACYIHAAEAEGMGKIGVLTGLNGSGDLAEPARKVAMHIAASAPAAAVIADLDPGLVARERQVLTEQAEASGKPASVVEKMVEGRLRKFYQEIVLVEQAFVIDPDQTVGAFLAAHKAQLSGFVMFRLGDGVEKAQDDFATKDAVLTTR